MDNKQNIIDKDRARILELGGPVAVCERLGYDKANGGVQRVQNWMTRGIPAQVKIDHPDLFLGARLGRRHTGRRSTDKNQ
jgi:hypothetical protein